MAIIRKAADQHLGCINAETGVWCYTHQLSAKLRGIQWSSCPRRREARKLREEIQTLENLIGSMPRLIRAV